jgi:hypothetical protein
VHEQLLWWPNLQRRIMCMCIRLYVELCSGSMPKD